MSKRGLGVQPWGSMDMNIQTFWEYFNQLKEYAINMFEWINVPETIDVRYLEMQLFQQGYLCFFKDDILGYLALQCTLGGRFNVYNLPTIYQIHTPSGFSARRTKKDSVIIYNNYLHLPTVRTIMMFAYRLYSVQRTIDVMTKQLRKPTVILCPEDQVLSFKNFYNEVDGNEEVIFGYKELDMSGYTSLNTGVKNETLALNQLKRQYMNEVLTFLGINNANTEKKERMIVSEVESNDEQILSARNAMLNARKQACKEINKMFGLNIDVRFRVYEQQLEEKERELEIEEKASSNNEKAEPKEESKEEKSEVENNG